MLLLYAEVRNLLNYNSHIKFKCHNIKTNRVEQVLKQISFLKLCGYKSKIKLTRPDVIHWKFCSGTCTIGEKFDLVIQYDTTYQDLRNGFELYGGCVEATKNVIKHAYVEQNRDIPVATDKEAWWCFTQIKDKKLHVIICDLGVSIPYTLPERKKDLFQLLRMLFGANLTDADMLEGAIGAPSSRSGESYRGNGLPTIREIAKINEGTLTIFSRNGMVKYMGTSPHPIKRNYRVPLRGTVIAWVLPLGAENADNIHS